MIAVPTICGPLILTDRRVSTFSSSLVGAPRETIEDRLLSHVDVGGRMVRVGASWIIGGGGSAVMASEVLRAVLEAGSTKPPAKEWTPETMGRWTLEVAGIVAKIAAELSPEAAAEVADTTFFVTLDAPHLRGNVFGIKWDGTPTGGWRTVYHAPANLGEYTKGRLAMNLEKDVATLSDWPSIVRRVAGECVLVSRLCKTVSPTCEVACGDRFYTGDAKALTKMSDEEIIRAFGDAPSNGEALDRVRALAPTTSAHAQTFGSGTGPSIATGLSTSRIGTGYSLTVEGKDLAGTIVLTTGTGITTAVTLGTSMFVVTFGTAYAANPHGVITSRNRFAADLAAAAGGAYFIDPITTDFSLICSKDVTFADSTTYKWSWTVIG